ncbi:MAG TPA: porin, partial [Planctomycetaceae bacterium]|nr:porin [Planctomycetaceae bacterium]
MARNSWKIILCSFIAVVVGGHVMADEFMSLKARLDTIEAENAKLREDIDAVRDSEENLIGKMTDLDAAIDKKENAKDPAKEDPLTMTSKWNNGWEASTKDKRFKYHVGGRLQFDTVFLQNSVEGFAGTGATGGADSVNFRRARLRADGTMYGTIDWVTEYDFVNNVNVTPGTPGTEGNIVHVPAPTDLWVNFREVPLVGNIRVGNVKEPMGLEHLTSSRYLDFMERSFNQDVFYGAFNNGFTPGIMCFDNWSDDDRGTWATGFFKNTTNAFAYGIGDGEYAWTSRLTYLPWYDEEGRYLMHLGVAGSIRDPNNHAQQYRTRGSLRNGPGGLNPVLANTGSFNTTEVEFGGLEWMMQIDSLILQSEYTCAWNQKSVGNGTSAPAGAQLGNVFVYGWYAEALYFLTGEHRDYEKKSGAFGRVIPD